VIGRELGMTSFQYDEELGSRIVYSHASHVLARMANWLLAIGVLAVAARYAWKWKFWRSAQTTPSGCDDLSTSFLMTHLLILLCAAVFSPQYLLWLLPVLLPFVGRSSWIVGTGIIIGMLIQLQFPMVEGLRQPLKEAALSLVFTMRN